MLFRSICSKQFKNNYNLRRHQSVHTGVRMKGRAPGQPQGASSSPLAGGRPERHPVPLSLLHLSIPPPLPPPGVLAPQQTSLGSQAGDGVAMASVVASVNNPRDFHVAQWLRIRLPMQGTQVQALVWEDPTCRGATRPVSHNY